MSLTHIYFDWSGTVAHDKSKHIFIRGPSAASLSTLYPDTIDTLQYLTNKGYTLGIITNTRRSIPGFLRALEATKLQRFFQGAIVFSNERNQCKKPCANIFKTALKQDKIQPNQAIMVGNNYEKDIIGAHQAGLGTIFIDRSATKSRGVADGYILDLATLKTIF